MESRDQRGGLAPFVLILLYAVSSQVFSLAVMERRWLGWVDRKFRAASEEGLLWDQASRFVEAFLAAGGDHPTPQMLESLPGYSHRSGTRFYYEPLSDTTLSLEELSSRLNPNFDSIGFWQTPPLSNRITSHNALLRWDEERRTRRIEDPEDLNAIFPAEDWDFLYTLYSLQGPGGPETWNIHFMDPLMLEAAVWYPWEDRGFEKPDQVFRRLSGLLRKGSVTKEELLSVLCEDNPEPGNALAARLGTRSWFWRIRVTSRSGGLDLIIRYFEMAGADNSQDDSREGQPRCHGFQIVSWKQTGGHR